MRWQSQGSFKGDLIGGMRLESLSVQTKRVVWLQSNWSGGTIAVDHFRTTLDLGQSGKLPTNSHKTVRLRARVLKTECRLESESAGWNNDRYGVFGGASIRDDKVPRQSPNSQRCRRYRWRERIWKVR